MMTKCVKCGETLISPDWSEFVSESLVINLWVCTTCGDRFEIKAWVPESAEPKKKRDRLGTDVPSALGGINSSSTCASLICR